MINKETNVLLRQIKYPTRGDYRPRLDGVNADSLQKLAEDGLVEIISAAECREILGREDRYNNLSKQYNSMGWPLNMLPSAISKLVKILKSRWHRSVSSSATLDAENSALDRLYDSFRYFNNEKYIKVVERLNSEFGLLIETCMIPDLRHPGTEMEYKSVRVPGQFSKDYQFPRWMQLQDGGGTRITDDGIKALEEYWQATRPRQSNQEFRELHGVNRADYHR